MGGLYEKMMSATDTQGQLGQLAGLDPASMPELVQEALATMDPNTLSGLDPDTLADLMGVLGLASPSSVPELGGGSALGGEAGETKRA